MPDLFSKIQRKFKLRANILRKPSVVNNLLTDSTGNMRTLNLHNIL